MQNNSEQIRSRLSALRENMKKNGVDLYLMSSTDCHVSEYVCDFFKVTEFMSGCTSDNVTLIVAAEPDAAWLWTDGRYFISAAKELAGTGIALMKDGEPGVPSVEAFLTEHLTEGKMLGFDGTMISAKSGAGYRAVAEKNSAGVRGLLDLVSDLWTGRPDLPCHPVMVLSDELAGCAVEEKLSRVRDCLAEEGARYLVLSRLDDIMWLTNLRGFDIPCNPVALSYAFIGPDRLDLFLQEEAGTEELDAYVKARGIILHPYEDIFNFLTLFLFDGPILCDSASSTDAMVHLLRARGTLLDKKNPTELLKACKNETEMANIRKYYLLDSVALCKFLYRIKTALAIGEIREPAEDASGKEDDTEDARVVPEDAFVDDEIAPEWTEMAAARLLDGLREQIPGFLELSFPTIPAYNANAAMAHYSPEGDGVPIAPHGFLLVDSGGQYMGATTDVTRTISLGGLTQKMKRDFTLVAVSHLRLLYTIFKSGTTGSQVDYIAREPLYRYGLNYNHGTGHGIGYILNVHEGPQRIGPIRNGGTDTALMPGMVTSDEPGIYREGEYGIRTESITLTVPYKETEFGSFLRFECLTWAPIDRDAIDTRYMTAEDLVLLNAYHATVFAKVSPYLEGPELAWLSQATKPVAED